MQTAVYSVVRMKETVQEEKGILKIKKTIKPFDNVRFAGEDIKKELLSFPKEQGLTLQRLDFWPLLIFTRSLFLENQRLLLFQQGMR